MAGEILKRTHTSTGSKKSFTYSFWFKSNIIPTSNSYFFALGPDGLNQDDSRLLIGGSSPNKLTYTATDVGISGVITDDGIRDYGSWYHFMVVVDTTIAHANDRVKLYINGVRKDVSYTTTAAQNANISHNTAGEILLLGSYRENSANFSAEGYYTDIFNVDGQALTPDVFGFYKDGDGYVSAGSTQATDFRPGQWVPKSPSVIKNVINDSGGFGVNGFYLPMNDSSNNGADFHCDPNSIITLKGEDLPQPRNGAPTTTDAYVSQLRTDPYGANIVLAVPGIALENTNTELVTNGTFDTGISGWSAFNATISWDSLNQRIEINAPTEFDGVDTSSGISVAANTNYTLEVDVNLGTAGGVRLQVRNSANSAGIKRLDVDGSGKYAVNFNSGANTSVYIRLITSAGNTGTAYFDNVSLKLAVPVRDYSADIKGSGSNKTLTANGDAGVGYELGNYYGSAMTFDGTDDYLTSPNSSDFSFGTGDFTIEFWLFRDVTNASECVMSVFENSSARRSWLIETRTNSALRFEWTSDGTSSSNVTTANNSVPGDQWVHICCENYNNFATVYVNGVAAGINNNTGTIYNNTQDPLRIGILNAAADQDFTGNIQDIRIYKGLAKYKGGFDVPKPYTPVGIESWRATTDTCSNNFATLNSLDYTSSTTVLSEGNLTMNATSNNGRVSSTTFNIPNSGKYYFEFLEEVIDLTTTNYISIVSSLDSSIYQQYRGYGYIYTDGVQATGYTTMDEGDLVGVAIDADNGTVSFYNNGTLVATVTSSSVDNVRNSIITSYLPRGASSYPPGDTRVYNFGQNPSFSGNVTAGTNADDSGKGLFKYAPPTGFLALCEDNLPTPAIADPGDYFKTVLWTGDGNSGRGITGVGFKPDFVWIKDRGDTSSHSLFDSVRGAGIWLGSNSTAAEQTAFINVYNPSFNNDGFGVGTDGAVNGSGSPYVAWCWKAGGAAVSNTDGTITSQVSANQTAGFSIVSYTANQTSGATVGHGLGKTPKMIIVKQRSGNINNWTVYHAGTGNTIAMYLDLTNAESDYLGAWNDTSPTSSVFSLGNSNETNRNSSPFIAYCWSEIEGFSKFGSYVGNGSADGPFVYCGFKPAFIMFKNASATGNWVMSDSSRDSVNPAFGYLVAESSAIEERGNALFDSLSNGFKIRNAWTSFNGNTNTIIFMAFAESPFKTANAK